MNAQMWVMACSLCFVFPDWLLPVLRRFQRGAPSDFDEWAKIVEGMDGAEGWAYSELEK